MSTLVPGLRERKYLRGDWGACHDGVITSVVWLEKRVDLDFRGDTAELHDKFAQAGCKSVHRTVITKCEKLLDIDAR